MQRLKILGLALMAVFALSAIVTAMASAAVVVLPAAEETWKGESGKTTLEVLPGGANHRVVCAKALSEGTIEKEKPLGLFHVILAGCKIAELIPCTGLGDIKEEILILGTYHLVFDKLGAALADAGVGALHLLEPVHFECAGGLFVVEGQVLSLIKPVNQKVKHFEIVFEQKEGDPKETGYWDEAGKEVKMGLEGLLIKENEKEGVMGAVLMTGLLLTPKELELMT